MLLLFALLALAAASCTGDDCAKLQVIYVATGSLESSPIIKVNGKVLFTATSHHQSAHVSVASGATTVSISGHKAHLKCVDVDHLTAKPTVVAQGNSVTSTLVAKHRSVCTIRVVGNVAEAKREVVAPVDADVSIFNTNGQDSIEVGSTEEYYMTLTITNAGLDTAQNVVVLDQVDPRLTITRIVADPPLLPGGNFVTCSGAKPDGSFDNLVRCSTTAMVYNPVQNVGFTVFIYFKAPRSVSNNNLIPRIDNSANVTSTTPDVDLANNQGSNNITLVILADLEVTLTGFSTVTAGASQAYDYGFQVCNKGLSNALSVQANWTFPADLIIVGEVVVNAATPSPISPTPQCTRQGQLITCNGFDLPSPLGGVNPIPCQSFAVSVRVLSTAQGPTGGTVTIAGSAYSIIQDPDLGNNAKVFPVKIEVIADIRITKSGDLYVVAGDPNGAKFDMVITNAGPSQAYGVRLQDFVPAPFINLTAVTEKGTCFVTQATSNVTCDIGIIPVLPANNRVIVNVTYNTPASTPATINSPSEAPGPNNITNFGSITATSPDTKPVDNVDPHYVGIVNRADIWIRKTCPSGPLISGTTETSTFQLTIGNRGPSYARNVIITDPIPSQFVVVGLPVTTGPVESCTIVNNLLRCTVNGPLIVGTGENALITVTVSFRPRTDITVDTTAINIATVQSSTYELGTEADNTARCDTLIRPPPDLTIQKTGPSSILVNDPTKREFFTIRVINNGPTTGRQVGMTDLVPSQVNVIPSAITITGGVGGYSWAANCDPFSPDASPNQVTCQFGDLPFQAGNDIIIVVPFTVPANAVAASLLNCANVSATLDSNLNNNRACHPFELTNGASLTIAKSTQDVCAGATGVYVITVTNSGPSDAENTSVFDQLRAPFTPTSILSTTVNGVARACTGGFNASNYLSLNCGTLANQSVLRVTFGYAVAASVRAQQVFNTASTSTTRFQNNVGDDTVTIASNILECTDLTTVKTGTSPVIAGAIGLGYVYTVTASNAGPTFAANVKIIDTMPVYLTATAATASDGGVCTITRINGNTQSYVECNWAGVRPSLAPVSVVIGFTVTSNAPVSNATNCGSSSTTSTEANTGNNVGCTTTSIVNQADVRIRKVASANCVQAGSGTGSFTFYIDNYGPSFAYDVKAVDSIPSPFVYAPGTLSVTGAQASGSTICRVENNVILCSLGTLAVTPLPVTQSAIIVTFEVTAPSFSMNVPSIINTATVDSGCSAPVNCARNSNDPILDNNSASAPQCIAGTADLSITKVCNPGPLISGKQGPYFFTLTVTNSGPAFAYNVLVTDNLPASFVPLNTSPQNGFACEGFVGNFLKCSLSQLPNGQSASIVVGFRPVAGLLSDVTATNTAFVNSTTFDPTTPNSGTCQTLIRPPPDLTITKIGPASILVDQSSSIYEYTMTVTNRGPTTAENVQFFDTVPGPLVVTGIRVSGGAGGHANDCNAQSSGNTLRCSFGDLPFYGDARDTIQIVATFTVPANTQDSMVQNCAQVSATLESNTSNNEACFVTTLRGGANLMVIKTTDDPCIGTTSVYTISVNNKGPSPARAATLQDQLPSQFASPAVMSVTRNGVADPSSTCTFNATRALNCNFGTMAVNDNIVIQFSYSVPQTLRAGPVTNVVTVQSATADTIDPSDNSYTFTSNPRVCVDLNVTKVGGEPQVVSGLSGYTYTLTVTNKGPSAADSVSIFDVLPSTGFVITNVQSAGSLCQQGVTDGKESISCIWNQLFVVGRTETVVITYRVKEDTIQATAVKNCVQAISAGPTDQPADNVACFDTRIVAIADVQVTKTGPVSCVPASGTGTYTINVVNAGPSRAYDVTLTDPIPSPFVIEGGLNVTGNTASGDLSTCSIITSGPSSTISCRFGAFRPNDSVRVVYTLRAPASSQSATGIVNTATVTSRCSDFAFCSTQVNTADPNVSNNVANWSSSICAFADTYVQKTVGAGPFVAGNGLVHSFTVNVGNQGPAVAYNVVVKDLGFAGGLIQSISSAALGPCNLTSLSCTYSQMAVQQTDVITITFVILQNQVCGIYPNTATIASQTVDPNPGDNQSTVTVPVLSQHDLSITKQGIDEAIEGGQPGKFWVSFANTGPSDANNVVFFDNVPVPLTVTSVVTNNTDANECSFEGQQIRCQFGIVPAGTYIQVNYTYTVAPDAPLPPIDPNTGRSSVNNTACVNSVNTAACETELNPQNNCNSFVTDVVCVADLSVTKTDDASIILAGGGVVYTVTIDVANLAGPSQARNVVVTDSWPLAYTKVGQLQWNRSGIVCSGLDEPGPWACQISNMAVGQVVRFTQQYTVRASIAPGFVTNEVVVAGSCRDPNPNNNVARDTNEIINRADLGIVKDDCDDVVIAGGLPNMFTFTVTNKGPSDGRSVIVSDSLPAQYDIVGSITFWGGAVTPVCTLIGERAFVCEYSRFPVGDVAYIGLMYQVSPDTLPTIGVVNCATVISTDPNVPDDILFDNEDCDSNDIETRADLSIVKTISTPTDETCIIAGDNAASVYTVTVTNNGPSYAQNVVLYEKFPAGILLTSALPSGCFSTGENAVQCNIGQMQVLQNYTVTFPFTVKASTPAGIISNFASTLSTTVGNVLATFDPELCNNNVTLPALVCVKSDLSITKDDGVDVTTAGEQSPPQSGVLRLFKYNISATNHGPSDALNVVIDDVWPVAMAGYHRAEIKGATLCRETAKGFSCEFADVKVGETVDICVYYTVDPCAMACEACNSVIVSSDSVDPVPENNLAVDCNQVRTEADLSVCKSDNTTTVTAGDGIIYTYTMEVCNAGPSCALKVNLVDHFPVQINQIAGSIRILNGSPGSCIRSSSSNDFSCNLLTLNVGECVTVEVDYSVPAATETCSLHNSVTVSSITFDPNLCNNKASDTNALVETARLHVVKTASESTINVNDYSAKAYTVVVSNAGPSVARDVVVTDLWPMELCQYPERITTSQGQWVSTGADVTASLGDIAPQSTATIIIPFSVCAKTAPGPIVNRVNAFSPTDETCRDGDQTVTITGVKRSNAVRNEPVARVAPGPMVRTEATVIRSVPENKAAKKALHVDISLAPIKAQVLVNEVGRRKYEVTVKNVAQGLVRITEVKSSIGSAQADVTKVGGVIVRTTCDSFADRKLPGGWSERCIFETTEDIGQVSVSGAIRMKDGVHAVVGAATLVQK